MSRDVWQAARRRFHPPIFCRRRRDGPSVRVQGSRRTWCLPTLRLSEGRCRESGDTTSSCTSSPEPTSRRGPAPSCGRRVWRRGCRHRAQTPWSSRWKGRSHRHGSPPPPRTWPRFFHQSQHCLQRGKKLLSRHDLKNEGNFEITFVYLLVHFQITSSIFVSHLSLYTRVTNEYLLFHLHTIYTHSGHTIHRYLYILCIHHTHRHIYTSHVHTTHRNQTFTKQQSQ